ncbi:hypothetical protein HD554DRAFT_2197419 [Boletus coccyginus]|nr:hypothetical protein HD554DRAFT_2197419 [Boletus coccyginus]
MPNQLPKPEPMSGSKTTTHACSIPPPSHFADPEHANDKGFALVSQDAWPLQYQYYESGKRKIRYNFVHTRGWTQKRENAVLYTIKGGHAAQRGFETWEDWANISFEPADVGNADIRIGFEPGGSWSAVGSGADKLDRKKPSLNLGWLQDLDTPTPEDRSTILHEFGHALGMMHEHQSPARGEYIHLKELEVYRYYEPLLGSRALVKSQIIDTYNEGQIMNMSKLDLESIMM